MYFGSVRFFKHLILGGLVLMITVPILFGVALGAENRTLRAQTADMETHNPPPAAVVPEKPVVPPLAARAAENAPPAPETPYYQALCPDLYAPEAPRATVNEEKTVYLTFDDGPSARTTEVLAVLEQYGVKATFFVVGAADEQSAQWMRDIVAAGHTLGIHTYAHNYETVYATVESFLEDYDRVFAQVRQATGATPAICRFPGGSINGYNGANYHELIAEVTRRGFAYFDWNVDSGDAAETGLVPVSRLVENALSRADTLRRAVILFHDSAAKTTTPQALPEIIEGYQAAGFTFAPLTPQVAPVIYGYPD